MEWNADTLQFLSQCFLNTLSPAPEPRRAAESQLSEASNRVNYGLVVLRLVAEPSVDEQIRHAAAVNFKNHLRFRWAPVRDSTLTAIADQEKDQIKALIVSLMLRSSARVQSQLSEALSVIGKHDFPKQWPALLPELVVTLQQASQSADYASINGILGTVNSIFKKFRYEYKTNDLLLDLKYCLDNFAAPLLEIFLKTAAIIDSQVSSGGSAVSLRPLFESQRLCCRIFYSLNFQDLPEFFEDHMNEWMGEFRKYLTKNYPALETSGDGLALVDEVRAAVCENISLYMEKNEEEFKGYLNEFALAVWTLLGNVSQSPSRDKLAVMAIKFLTTVSTSVHHTLFAGEGVIPQICQSIVIPNVRLREDDEELFEMNYVEFIRRDMEGSDVDTRRRIACELLKGIATNYKEQVMKMVSEQVQSLLSSFAANPIANWKDKDCAIYLVVSLATKKAGGNSVSTEIVDVKSFFASVILPELQSQDANGFPMLKAGALKFFTMFRSHISKPVALQLVSDVVRFLGAESNVVHSYAANCIEKLLLVKDEGGRARYTSADITPILPVLINNLFNALKFPESEENQYVMKCIMRVLGAADISGEVAVFCINGLTFILNAVCSNPKNPIFNHYLFESVAMLVKRACERDISLISSFEEKLFPSIQAILANDVTEFLPYAFQLLAQLVELNRPPLSQSYMQIFVLLLSPDSWKRTSNVPALVRLLQAFLQKAPHELTQEGRLTKVLGIFEMLVLSSSTDDQGFYVLNTVIENLEYGGIAPFVHHIWSTLFGRLQRHRTIKFIKSLLIFMSLFIVKHGSGNLVDTMNAVQPNIFLVILEQFWIPNLKLITGTIELKLTAVASTKLICESPALLDAAGARHWGKMLDSIVTLLSRPEDDRVEDEPEMPDIGDNIGYTATFVRLYNAGKKEEDPLKDIKDPKEFLVASLGRLSAISPGRYPQIISENLEPANQAALMELCRTYNCPII
ncbi:Exportin-2 -like protein [Tripterygium wilfordii]|uniref:Exportin-2 -like protein n=1 Tax=Tripterygium wilfordii TaxID=458696 RepID=A0A7J7CHH0_TRIWF|nr:exportin-2-like [Tripterygium wilfordii]XP_038681660.1 exportin-2-like [Tripterygium wilfordii]KAF5733505.1 Exportin-2 -like protein [Tripterygium wilfordii]